MAKTRTFSIVNGTDADLVIGAVNLTGDTRYTLAPITLPLTILANEEYVATVNFDDSNVVGVHKAQIEVVSQDAQNRSIVELLA